MRRWALLFIAFSGTLLLLPQCVSTPAGVSITSRAPKDTTETNEAWQSKRAWIFIEGVQQGQTPASVVVRRDFEVTNLSLHTGSKFEQVRRYEFERVVTSNRRMLDYSFQGSVQNGRVTFNTFELSQDRKGNYVVPYYPYEIQIIDNEYELELIVRD